MSMEDSFFSKLTSNTNQFTNCLNSLQPLQEQCDNWKTILESYCKQAFPVIWLRQNKIQFSLADKLIKERNYLKKKQDDDDISTAESNKLKQLDNEIADILEEEEKEKAYKFKKHCVQNRSVSVKEMWNLKKRLWPKLKESVPTGKINHLGKLVTSPEEIKNLLHKEFNERLRPRSMNPYLKHIEELKIKTFELKLGEAKKKKSPDWTMNDLDKVLKDINRNKSRDPDGINRSIFHLDTIGVNLKDSLLILFNKIKSEGQVPKFMKKAHISTIPKTGSKFVLRNERGIFVLSAVRTLLMRLLYNTSYNTINNHMSDRNVGGRKCMSSINHIFVINGIIHETLSSKNVKPVTFQILDFKQLFD